MHRGTSIPARNTATIRRPLNDLNVYDIIDLSTIAMKLTEEELWHARWGAQSPK